MCLTLHRHLCANVLVKRPTWLSRESLSRVKSPVASPSRQICTLPSFRPALRREGNWVQHKRELVPVLAGERVWGILSWPISTLLEACTQVALNVDFGRARAQRTRAGFQVALVEWPGPLPAISSVPSVNRIQGGLLPLRQGWRWHYHHQGVGDSDEIPGTEPHRSRAAGHDQ